MSTIWHLIKSANPRTFSAFLFGEQFSGSEPKTGQNFYLSTWRIEYHFQKAKMKKIKKIIMATKFIWNHWENIKYLAFTAPERTVTLCLLFHMQEYILNADTEERAKDEQEEEEN
jgi:hypothetical protein